MIIFLEAQCLDGQLWTFTLIAFWGHTEIIWHTCPKNKNTSQCMFSLENPDLVPFPRSHMFWHN